MKDYTLLKHRLSKEEQEGMARIVEAVRLKRIEATNKHEDVKNVEGVGRRGYTPVLGYGE